MNLLLNTSNPIIIILYTLIVSAIIYIARKTRKPIILIIAVVLVVSILVFHSISLDKISSVENGLISQTYRCIAVDLILLLLTFIAYLWVDDTVAKEKNLKNYDNSLNWFWDKI